MSTKRKKQKQKRFLWKKDVFWRIVLLRGRKTSSTDLVEKCQMTLSAWGMWLQNTGEKNKPKQVSVIFATPELLFWTGTSSLFLRVCREPQSLRWCRIERVSRKGPNRDNYGYIHCSEHQQHWSSFLSKNDDFQHLYTPADFRHPNGHVQAPPKKGL